MYLGTILAFEVFQAFRASRAFFKRELQLARARVILHLFA